MKRLISMSTIFFLFIAPAFSKTMVKFEKEAKCCEMLEQALMIIKPEAVAENHIGDILEKLEKSQLRVIGMKMTRLNDHEIEALYKDHLKKPYFESLSKYMRSGPIVAVAIEGRDAIKNARELAGTTDPQKAPSGTLRSQFGTDKQRNAVHVSDSVKASKREIPLFFTLNELYSPCAKEVFKPVNETHVQAKVEN